ncbi:MAG TPA: acetolactate synthase small subunit [Lachnospiraceae bacterium]|nr:acetolactate synthase small subunit [Lachnospiraceae bacterium]
MNRHILSILVNNQPSVLSRVVGLFSRRGYNISSLSVGVTEVEDKSRITVVLYCDDKDCEQIRKQVDKLEDVLRIVELSADRGVFRELALIKVSVPPEKRSEVVSIANVFRANIVDVGTETLTIEMTGESSKIEVFSELMQPYGIKETVRTGLTGLCRGNNPIKKD